MHAPEISQPPSIRPPPIPDLHWKKIVVLIPWVLKPRFIVVCNAKLTPRYLFSRNMSDQKTPANTSLSSTDSPVMQPCRETYPAPYNDMRSLTSKLDPSIHPDPKTGVDLGGLFEKEAGLNVHINNIEHVSDDTIHARRSSTRTGKDEAMLMALKSKGMREAKEQVRQQLESEIHANGGGNGGGL